MIDSAALRRRPPSIDRSSDRLVALAAIAIAVAFLVAAGAAVFLPATERRGIWLPLHLALAGAATTAIAGIMPFFTAALAAAPPSDRRLRAAAVGAVSLGAAGLSLGVVTPAAGIAVAGGIAFVAGIVLTGSATLRPLRRALGPSRGIVTQGYLAALAEVAIGASIATLYLAGWPPLVDAWARLKPAHAWLNLVGFVSVVIATTLLHFFPTVVGARIAARTSARLTVAGLALGAPTVATGFALPSDLLARLGALVVIIGSAGLATYVWRTWPGRARWTTDPDWHRFAIGGLVSAIAWFEAGIAIAAGRVIAFGADPAGWWPEALTAPLVAGWLGLAFVASASHLVPAIGPGDPAAHARQRGLLGRAATFRLAAANAGTAALAIGIPLGLDLLVAIGAVLVAGSLAGTAILLVAAVQVGITGPRSLGAG